MDKSKKYCDMCVENHCGQKAFNLFPEDEAKYLLKEVTMLPLRVCETHKKVLMTFGKATEKDFVTIRNKKEGVKQE